MLSVVAATTATISGDSHSLGYAHSCLGFSASTPELSYVASCLGALSPVREASSHQPSQVPESSWLPEDTANNVMSTPPKRRVPPRPSGPLYQSSPSSITSPLGHRSSEENPAGNQAGERGASNMRPPTNRSLRSSANSMSLSMSSSSPAPCSSSARLLRRQVIMNSSKSNGVLPEPKLSPVQVERSAPIVAGSRSKLQTPLKADRTEEKLVSLFQKQEQEKKTDSIRHSSKRRAAPLGLPNMAKSLVADNGTCVTAASGVRTKRKVKGTSASAATMSSRHGRSSWPNQVTSQFTFSMSSPSRPNSNASHRR
eukprot:gb/GEZN01007037.1/.p1 GENE.gb/GEZN01007037.1/~~gb/GEZN01007037.1/.p1  ORF type:complete len:312 (-),score=38.89 gb/GEZN01007037.1/:146-1081(-)